MTPRSNCSRRPRCHRAATYLSDNEWPFIDDATICLKNCTEHAHVLNVFFIYRWPSCWFSPTFHVLPPRFGSSQRARFHQFQIGSFRTVCGVPAFEMLVKLVDTEEVHNKTVLVIIWNACWRKTMKYI